MQGESCKVHIFCIPKKELKTYILKFTFSEGMGFHHVENSFYVGGGYLGDLANNQYFSQFTKIMRNGELREL